MLCLLLNLMPQGAVYTWEQNSINILYTIMILKILFKHRGMRNRDKPPLIEEVRFKNPKTLSNRQTK